MRWHFTLHFRAVVLPAIAAAANAAYATRKILNEPEHSHVDIVL